MNGSRGHLYFLPIVALVVMPYASASRACTPDFSRQESLNLPAGSVVWAVDLNGDGRPDLVISSDLGVQVSLNQGAGSFKEPHLVHPEGGLLAFGDLDRDGTTDLVLLALSGEISVFLGDGTGGFRHSQSVTSLASFEDAALADLDGDGFLDLIFVSAGPDGIWACLGDRAGGFRPPVLTPLPIVVRLWPFQLDEDGRSDLLVKHVQFGGSSLIALRSNGDGTFTAIDPGFPGGGFHLDYVLAIGDVDGDGVSDVVEITFGNGPTSTLNAYLHGPTGFRAVPSPDGLGATSTIVLADLNADGRVDLAALQSSGSEASLTVRIGNGHGTFESAQTFALPAPATALAASDLQEDGRFDLIASGIAGQPPQVFYNSCRPHRPAVPGSFIPVRSRSRTP